LIILCCLAFPAWFAVLPSVLPATSAGSTAVQTPLYAVVNAGSLDRKNSLVSFAFEKGSASKSYVLRDEAGNRLPLQVDTDGIGTFVLPELKAGSSRRYRIEVLSRKTAGTSSVSLSSEHDRLTITANNRKVLTYQSKTGELPSWDIKPVFRRGGYIQSVYTPSGRLVTDDFPPDHYHHHAIWFAWTETEFQGRRPDFWNVDEGTGDVEFVALDGSWIGPVHGGFKSRTRYVDLSAPRPTTVLTEQWLVRVYNVAAGAKPYAIFDLVSTHECATSSALVLPEYRYGGLGFRGNRQWLPKDNCFFLTSEGKDRSNGHATRARWCHIGGRIDGELAGIAIMDHPSNFRAPQPMRINPDQPFFCYAPSQMGPWSIEPGKPYVSRYRFVVQDGAPDKAELDRLWNDYATPAQVTLTR
jgi:hypothetical protein